MDYINTQYTHLLIMSTLCVTLSSFTVRSIRISLRRCFALHVVFFIWLSLERYSPKSKIQAISYVVSSINGNDRRHNTCICKDLTGSFWGTFRKVRVLLFVSSIYILLLKVHNNLEKIKSTTNFVFKHRYKRVVKCLGWLIVVQLHLKTRCKQFWYMHLFLKIKTLL